MTLKFLKKWDIFNNYNVLYYKARKWSECFGILHPVCNSHFINGNCMCLELLILNLSLNEFNDNFVFTKFHCFLLNY